jgi:hypothetical protein
MTIWRCVAVVSVVMLAQARGAAARRWLALPLDLSARAPSPPALAAVPETVASPEPARAGETSGAAWSRVLGPRVERVK